jgi:hypothetical protein
MEPDTDTDLIVMFASGTDTDTDLMIRLASNTMASGTQYRRPKLAKTVLVSYRHCITSKFLATQYQTKTSF